MTVTSIQDITSFKWATVTAVKPIAIKLDGDTSPLALIPDSLVDPQELIVGDRVRVELSLRKCVIHGAANGGGQSGEVKMTAATGAPRGWLLCQGQSLLRTDYPRLFVAIGTTYGAADSTHFTLPDLRGRVAVGYDPNQTEFNTLGKTGGEKAHALTTAEMPQHQHNYNSPQFKNVVVQSGSGNTSMWGGPDVVVQTTNVGSGTAHNILQPYTALNYIIKI